MRRRWFPLLLSLCMLLLPAQTFAAPTTSSEIKRAERAYRQAEAELNKIQKEIASIDQQMSDNFQQLDRVKQQEAQSKKRLKKMMVRYYLLGQDKTTAHLLSAESVPQFFFRLQYFQLMMERDKKAIQEYKKQIREITAMQKRIQQQAEQSQPLLQTAEKKSKHLQQQYQQLVAAAKREEEQKKRYAAEKETEQKDDINPIENIDKPVDQSWLHKARAMIGVVKYRFGASNYPYFDCSGWTQYVFKTYRGISLPRTSSAQAKVGTPVEKSDLQPGDLVFFQGTYKSGISHVGIYLGNGKYISNKNERLDLQIDSLNDSYQREHYWGARRVNK